jgi:hypothetical protein
MNVFKKSFTVDEKDNIIRRIVTINGKRNKRIASLNMLKYELKKIMYPEKQICGAPKRDITLNLDSDFKAIQIKG